jgi:hypothetical protein
MDKIKFVTIPILILIPLMYFGSRHNYSNGKSNYQKFYEDSIAGELTYIGIKNHGVEIRLKNSSDAHVFYPLSDEVLNDGQIFQNFAEKGDFVSKKSSTDTLLLIKNNRVYKFNSIIIE